MADLVQLSHEASSYLGAVLFMYIVVELIFTAHRAAYLAAPSPMITCIDKTKYTGTLARKDWDI